MCAGMRAVASESGDPLAGSGAGFAPSPVLTCLGQRETIADDAEPPVSHAGERPHDGYEGDPTHTADMWVLFPP